MTEIYRFVCTQPALQRFSTLSFMYKLSVAHTSVLFLRHSATHVGSLFGRRSFHIHFPPQDFRNFRNDWFVSSCLKTAAPQCILATLLSSKNTVKNLVLYYLCNLELLQLCIRQKRFFWVLATNYNKFAFSIKLHYILMRWIISASHFLPPGRGSSNLYSTFVELSL